VDERHERCQEGMHDVLLIHYIYCCKACNLTSRFALQPSIGLDEGDDEIDEMTKMIPREVRTVAAQDTHTHTHRH
jgi:hypothetical protein